MRDLPALTTFSLGNYAFEETIDMTITSIFYYYYFDLDIPFTNGTFTSGKNVFLKLRRAHFSYDQSSLLIYHIISSFYQSL